MSNYLRVLKKYGILFEDENGWVASMNRIPNKKEGETFKQWKIRTFGEDIDGLKVYGLYEPTQQTRMSTLRNAGGASYLLQALNEYRKLTDDEVNSVIDSAVEAKENEVTSKLTTFPNEILRDILDDLGEDLEPSASDFFNRYLASGNENVNTKEMLSELIGTYNNVVEQFREKSI